MVACAFWAGGVGSWVCVSGDAALGGRAKCLNATLHRVVRPGVPTYPKGDWQP